MNARVILVAIALAASALTATAADADTLYQSIPDLAAPAAGSVCSPCDGQQTAGSRFSLGSAGSVNSIQFVTGDYGWNWYGNTDVIVSIYKDAGIDPQSGWGTIGDKVYQQDFTSYASTDLPESHLLGFNTGGVNLGAGNYLIFFNNLSILAPMFYNGDGQVITWPDDPLNFSNVSYMPWSGTVLGFALSTDVIGGNAGPQPPAVPEPTTWLAFIIGFCLLGGTMRYRTAKRASPKLS